MNKEFYKFIRKIRNNDGSFNYAIYPTVNGRKKYYDSFDDLKVALHQRDLFIRYGGDEDKIKEDTSVNPYTHMELPPYPFKTYNPQCMTNNINERCIYKRKKSYTVQITRKGKHTHINNLESLDLARSCRLWYEFFNDLLWTPFNNKYNLSIKEKCTTHIYKVNHQYYVVNIHYNYELYRFAPFESLEEAQQCEVWFKFFNGIFYNPFKYIRSWTDSKGNEKYGIFKSVNGVNSGFGTFSDLEECMSERDFCINCNWDWDLICEGNVELSEEEQRYGTSFKRAKKTHYKYKNVTGCWKEMMKTPLTLLMMEND